MATILITPGQAGVLPSTMVPHHIMEEVMVILMAVMVIRRRWLS